MTDRYVTDHFLPDKAIDALDEAGAGITAQAHAWLPDCIVTEGVDIDDLNSAELLRVLQFVRGDEEEAPEGALPLE